MEQHHPYLMENDQEAFRLDIKTDPDAVRDQARWCGIGPGMRVLDAGCGPGRVASILHETIQPGGRILGVDYSVSRIDYAKKHYGQKHGIEFCVHDLRLPLSDAESFDFVWIRFVLEYNRRDSIRIVENLTACLKPGGHICLLDLDYNCLNHYGLSSSLQKVLFKVIRVMEKEYDFDPYAGRKLYSYLYDLGYQDIQMDLRAHHLIYGEAKETDFFNWTKKLQVAEAKAPEVFAGYPGGYKKFYDDFVRFFNDPRRFTYTPLILCKAAKPL